MRRLKSLALLLFPLFLLTGCPSDTTPVQTSVGIRPAGEVKTIDNVADVLAQLRDIQNAAVRAHDAKNGLEDAAVHSKRSKLLTDTGNGLKASTKLLASIKRGETSGSAMNALGPILALVRPFLSMAVDIGVLKQSQADPILAFLPAVTP